MFYSILFEWNFTKYCASITDKVNFLDNYFNFQMNWPGCYLNDE